MLSHPRAGNAAACSRNALSEALSPGSRTNAPAAARESGDPPSSDGAVLEPEGTSTQPSWRAFARAPLGRSRRVPGLGGVLPLPRSGTSRREVPVVTRAGPLCSHAHARHAGATGESKVNAFDALPVVAHRPNRTPRSAGRGRGNAAHSWACSGFTSQSTGRRAPPPGGRSVDRRHSENPRTCGAVHARLEEADPRSLETPVAAVRRPGGSGSRSVRERSDGQRAERQRRPRCTNGARSGRHRRETGRSRAPDPRPRGLEVILRVLFDKLGSHVLARRISSRRLRQEHTRETPRVPAARSRLPRSVRPRVFGA